MAIPKIIHQTVENHNHLLPEYVSNRLRIQSINPDWTMRLYTSEQRESFIRSNFNEDILSCYLSIDSRYGAARADLFRYLVILCEGGVYLDIKSTCMRPLSEVLLGHDTFVTAQWPMMIDGTDMTSVGKHEDLSIREYQNWFLIAEPGSQVLEAVVIEILENIRNYRPFKNGVGKHGVLRTTGPIAYSRIIHPFVENGLARLTTNQELGLKPTIHKIKNSSEPFPNKQASRHYSTLRIPIIRKSALNSFLISQFIRVTEKLKRFRSNIN